MNSMMMSTILDSVRVDSCCRLGPRQSCSGHVLAMVIDVFEVECVHMAWEVPAKHLALNPSLENFGVREKTYPRIVSRMLINKSPLQPEIKKTPTGGTIFCACQYVVVLAPKDKMF